MAQKDTPIVEVAGYLGKIEHLASAPVMDTNKQMQIIRLARKSRALLHLIAQPTLTDKEGQTLVHGEDA
jgi:hypothetical protein